MKCISRILIDATNQGVLSKHISKAALGKSFPGLVRLKLKVKDREIYTGKCYGRELLKRGETLRKLPAEKCAVWNQK